MADNIYTNQGRKLDVGGGGGGADLTELLFEGRVRFLPFLSSLNDDSKNSLCLCGIRFEIADNKIPFQRGYLFHKMTDDKSIYYGTTLENATQVGTLDYFPKDCVIGVSPKDGTIIGVTRDARSVIHVYNGTNHSVNAKSSDGANASPKGWLYNSGHEFINGADGNEYCLFAEYSGVVSDNQKMYVWKGKYPYTNASDWKSVFSLTTSYNSGRPTAGSITHWHMVRRDPFTNVLYITCGDFPNQLQWWYSTDEGETWTLLASDFDSPVKSTWEEHCLRTINFIFTKDYIYWATDHGTNHTLNRISRDANGVIDTSTRVKLADLPYGQATNTLCYVESPNGLFMFERIDTGYPSEYSKPIKVLFWSFVDEKIYVVATLKQLVANWGGHRGKCYFNYTNGQEPRPAMGFADNTKCGFDLIGADGTNIGTIFYEL